MANHLFRVVTTSVIGNALEFYDFTLIGVLITQIALTFFPHTHDGTTQLFYGFFEFGAAFLTRPFGASLFGYLGDRFGRRLSLSLSVTLMGFPALIIALLPGYETLGLLAPLVLVICRLCQGLCMGGELNGAAIFALEHAGAKRPGMISGLIVASCIAGAMLATFVARFSISEGMPEWAWRVPFIIGSCISFLGFFLRRSISETPEYQAYQAQKKKMPRISYINIVKQYPSSCLHSFMIGALNGVMTYTMFGFLTIYLTRYVKTDTAWVSGYIGYTAFIIASMLTGLWGDVIGASQAVYKSSLIATLFAVPCFFLMQDHTFISVVLGQFLFGAITGGFIGSTHAHSQRLFPVDVRFRGIAVSFSLGISIVGSCIGMMNTWLVEQTHNLYAPAFLISGIGFLFFVTFPRNLLKNHNDNGHHDHKESAQRAA